MPVVSSSAKPSFAMRAFTVFLAHTMDAAFADAATARVTARVNQGKGPAQISKSLVTKHHVSMTMTDSMVVRTLSPGEHARGPQILYVHGGGYVSPIQSAHWSLISDIVERTGATIDVPLYHMAPTYTLDDSLPTLLALYRRLDSTRPRFIMGDSAGGALALAVAQQLAHDEQPAHIVLFAPWLDGELTNPAVPEAEANDPMLDAAGLRATASWWAGSRPVADPLISPIHADFGALAPVDIFVGTADALEPDCARLAQLAAAKGWPVTVHTYAGGFHVFPGVPWLPESKNALDRVQRIVTSVS